MITCVIPTRDRYDSLFSCLVSVLLGSKKPNEILIYDDSVKKKNIFKQERFLYLKQFGVKIEVIPTEQIGQSHIHELSQADARYPLIWRIDDDCLVDKNCLSYLVSNMDKTVGAVGGLIHIPGKIPLTVEREQSINETNFHVQMCGHRTLTPFEVEHLHCSFLYQKGIVPFAYKILDKCGLCEETIFTHELYRMGYKLLVDPRAVTYHFQSKKGGMRDHHIEKGYEINREILEHKKKLWKKIDPKSKMIIDAHGIGDSIVLQKCLSRIIEPERDTWIFTQNLDIYKQEVFPRTYFLPVKEADIYYNNFLPDTIYQFMERKKWSKTIEEAYLEMHRTHSNGL